MTLPASSQSSPDPRQPYGVQQAQQPFMPPPLKRPGSTSTKVWGIVLIVLGGLGAISLLMTLASAFMGGAGTSAFAPGVDEQTKQEIEKFAATMMEDMLGRWSFWVYLGSEVFVVVLSILAGVRLAIRPKPIGRNLAIARAALVLLFLPVYGIENFSAMDRQMEMQGQMQKSMIDRQIREQAGNKGEKEIQRRQKESQEILDQMSPIMRGVTYGAVIFTVVFVMVLNGLLLFFMTRPSVKDYLESVAAEGTSGIPQLDPSMGLMMGPPPTDPRQGQPPPETGSGRC